MATASGLQKILKKYDFAYPRELIALAPETPRDAARLLIYDRRTGAVKFDRFWNLPKYLPPRSVLVFNQTKVVPARLTLKKETGGVVRGLYVGRRRGCLEFLLDRKIKIGSALTVDKRRRFRVKGRAGNIYLLKALWPLTDVLRLLARYGQTPLPPYLKTTTLTEPEARKKYQAIFALKNGSVAAPTASLHFTRRLLKKLKRAGHELVFITLHVGLGTFAPLTEKNLAQNKLHEERYEINARAAAALNRAKKNGRKIIAVGTTVCRALETATYGRRAVRQAKGQTSLFIKEGYKFSLVDGLITNFHVPRSSLLMLVAAFAGRRQTLALYQMALAQKFKLFSFGDGLLIT